ncbi:long-chain-fatty-acid--CoA ligase [Limibacillus halophilus]
METKDKPWIKSYPKGLDWNFETPVEPLYAALDRAVADFPERPALHFLGRRYSYAELGAAVDRVAGALQARGLEKGDHVGLFLPNTPYYVIFYYAVLKAGGVVINFNPLYTQPEVERQVRDAGCRIMVTLDMAMMLPKLHRLVERGELDGVVVCSLAGALPRIKGLIFPLIRAKQLSRIPDSPAYLSYSSLLKERAPLLPVAIDPREDVAVLQYTGGTTGVPKGAMLTHYNLVANRKQVADWGQTLRRGEERTLGVLPFFHVFAMTVVMNVAVEVASEMILLPRFELEEVLRTIERLKPTLFPAVPTIFNAINNHPAVDRFDLSSINLCISGGASLPVEVKSAFESRTGCKVVEGYGLSESAPVATCNPPHGVNKPGSIGLPFPGTEVEMRSLENPDVALALGETGEICVKGPQVMKGYWQRPDATAEVLKDGWLRTGDVGYMDADGYVFLVDRLKDLILCGGYNVYPRVIEEACYEHPAVEEVTVIGVADSYRGQSPKAFVKLREGRELGEEELLAFLRERLSPIEIPKAIEFRDSLPKTLIGKLSKKELIEEEAAKSVKSA